MTRVESQRYRKKKMCIYVATEICALLVYYAAYSGNSLPTFRDKPWSHLQGSWTDSLSQYVGKELPLWIS